MGKNIAAKRFAAAQRRKAALAGRRAAEPAAIGFAGRIREASTLPIRQCVLTASTIENVGMGTLMLVRGNSPALCHVGVFLLDTLGMGVKDVFFTTLDAAGFKAHQEKLEFLADFEPIQPADARRLLHDLVVWSAAGGYMPHPDYAAVEKLFGSVNCCDGNRTIPFGAARVIGLPAYIAEELLLEDGRFDLDVQAEAAD